MLVLAIVVGFILVAIQLNGSKTCCVVPVLLLLVSINPVLGGLVMVCMICWAAAMNDVSKR